MFSPPAEYATGTYPSAVATADLNRDGNIDVVTTNFGSSTVSVFGGNGDGTLAPGVLVPVGDQPQALAVGDFNGDGIPDLAVANSASNDVSILLGVGDGTFQPQVVYATGLRPESIAVADFNGDGRLDVVTADQGSSSLSLFFGNGDGTFAPAVKTFGGLEPDGIAVGDFNGDSHPDIVAVNPVLGNAHVLINRGDGTFLPAVTYLTGSTTRAVAVADLNADGRPDIVTANLHGTSISLLTNNGDGTFAAGQEFAAGAFPFSVTVADVNGDGRPEVITANNYDNNVTILSRTGTGTFNPRKGFHTAKTPVDVAVADLNNDGRPDFITADYNASQVTVSLNQTVFKPRISTTISLTPQLNPVQAKGPLTLTAQVTPVSLGKTVPKGIVQFFNGNKVLGLAHPSATGVAKIRTSLPVGVNTLTARYVGDPAYVESASPPVLETAVAAADATPFVTPTLTASHFPPVFLPGDRGRVSLAITNQGPGRARGTVEVRLFASTDGIFDSTAVPLVSSINSVSLNLIGGASRSVGVDFTLPTEASGPHTYTLFAVLTPGRGLTPQQVNSAPTAAATPVQTALAFGTDNITALRVAGPVTNSVVAVGGGPIDTKTDPRFIV